MRLGRRRRGEGSQRQTGGGGTTLQGEIVGRGPWELAWRRLRRDRVAMISLGLIVFFVLVAVFAPVVASITGHGPNDQYYGPNASSILGQGQPPNGDFWLGTDKSYRDVLVRIAYGARVSLGIGVLATLVTMAIGIVVGLVAGYFGGWVDTVLARFIDVVLAMPFILTAIALVSLVGPSLTIEVVVIAFFSWASVARIVRGQVLSVKEREFVEAARSLGAGNIRIMFVEILPNLFAPILVYSTMLIPIVIVTEATLSFLGLGIPPPTPSWGNMIQEASEVYQEYWWFFTFPGLALVLLTLAFNLLGDGVRDAVDPRIDRLLAK